MNGVTLIELIIAMVLGLLLTAAVIAVYFGVATSTQVVASEVSRFRQLGQSISVIRQAVTMAGYRTDLELEREIVYPKDGADFAAGEVVNLVFNTTTAMNELTVRILGPDNNAAVYDCAGRELPSNVLAKMRFYVDVNLDELLCQSSIPGLTDATSVLGRNVLAFYVTAFGGPVAGGSSTIYAPNGTIPDNFIVRSLQIDLINESDDVRFSTPESQTVVTPYYGNRNFISNKKVALLSEHVSLKNIVD